MKYRIKHIDKSWLLFTPFAFALMDRKFDHYIVQKKKHWWNKWQDILSTDDIVDAYLKYVELTRHIKVPKYREFPHNRHKNITVTCKLELIYNPGRDEYTYAAAYRPRNYAQYYFCTYSAISYENALELMYCELMTKDILNKNEN